VRQVPLIIEPDPDDPDFAAVLVEATVAGRPYRLLLDTGAARSQLDADEYTRALTPVDGNLSSGAFGGRVTDPVVTVTDLIAGPLRVPALDVTRSEHGLGNLLGMDVLGQHRCHFRLDAGILDLETPGGEARHELLVGRRGHPYVEVNWPGVRGLACWDTGAGATVVNRAFWLEHPGIFEPIGTSAGTDAHGEQVETPLLLMSGPVIGQRAFGSHKAVAVDLSGVNSTLEYPMDLILGYPTIRQADWLFDFPARRWAVTS
jgi:gag-polyprotein putative aspartyl protease